MKFYVRIALSIEASGVNEAVEKINTLKDQEGFSDVTIEDGPDEAFIEEEEEEEEVEEESE